MNEKSSSPDSCLDVRERVRAQDHLRPARIDVRLPLQGFSEPGPTNLGVTFEAGDETFQQLGALLCTQAENLRLEVMIWRRHETSGALLWLQEAMRDI
jgi:hypothetical protein